jgi:hypothetical protein
VYIKPKDDYRIIPFANLLIFIYNSLPKYQAVTYENAEDWSNGFFVRALGVGDSKLHDTSGDSRRGRQ